VESGDTRQAWFIAIYARRVRYEIVTAPLPGCAAEQSRVDQESEENRQSPPDSERRGENNKLVDCGSRRATRRNEWKQDFVTTSTIAVDGVEVKSTLVGPQIVAAIESFGLDSGEAPRRVVYFFDVIEDVRSQGPRRPLRLLTAGVILRLRRRPNGRGESTLKLRPADPHRLIGRWAAGTKHGGEYRIEYDWAASRVLAASLDADLDKDLIDEVVKGPTAGG